MPICSKISNALSASRNESATITPPEVCPRQLTMAPLRIAIFSPRRLSMTPFYLEFVLERGQVEELHRWLLMSALVSRLRYSALSSKRQECSFRQEIDVAGTCKRVACQIQVACFDSGIGAILPASSANLFRFILHSGRNLERGQCHDQDCVRGVHPTRPHSCSGSS